MIESDGRVLRSIRSRELVAEGWASLVAESGTVPTMDAVAEVSGVSVRSIYRLFGDSQAVVDDGVAAQLRLIKPMLTVPVAPRASLQSRCDAVATAHGALNEALLHFRYFALDPNIGPTVVKALTSTRRARRTALTSVFDRELDQLDREARGVRLDALEAMAGWGMWHSLRIEQRVTRTRAQGIVNAGLRSILR